MGKTPTSSVGVSGSIPLEDILKKTGTFAKHFSSKVCWQNQNDSQRLDAKELPVNRRIFVKLTGLGLLSSNAVADTMLAPHPLPTGGVRWGLESLDSTTSLQPGEVGVVIGQAGSGKTMLMAGAAKHTLVKPDDFCSYLDSDATELVGQIRTHGGHMRLIVCDTLDGYPSDTPMSLCDRLRNIRQLACDFNVPILVGIRTNRMPKVTADADILDYHVYDWMRPVDLAIVCTKVHVQKKNCQYGNWTPAIQVSVVKNRYGPNNVLFTHGLSSTMLAAQSEK